MWCVDVYVEEKYPWMADYHPKQRESKYGVFYSLSVSNDEKRKVEKIIQQEKLRCKWYSSNFSRSNNYRDKFFKTHEGPYRCIYCHKKIRKDQIEVDHLIPISKAKNSLLARNLLYISGISDVNDPKNLVASCRRCNRKKGSKMGVWIIRGYLGRYRAYWIIHHIIVAAIIIFFCLYAIPMYNQLF